MDNVEEFTQIAGHIFVKLFKEFPLPCDIHCHEVSPNYDWAPSGRMNEIGQIHFHTFKFLKAEGFIKYSNGDDERSLIFRNCVLTSKGFTSSNKVTRTLFGKRNLISQLEDLKNGGVVAVGKAAINGLIRMLLS